MYSDTHKDVESKLLSTLSHNWNNRAAVRKERLNLDDYYDTKAPDFPIDMVPFWNFLDFEILPESDKRRVLAAAWVSYNEKTIYIEDQIITPLCALLLQNELDGVSNPITKQIIAQTLVDEQFHILMCLEVCQCARKQHQLQDFIVTEPLLGQRFSKHLAQVKDKKSYNLLRMAYATVAEMTINAFLKRISEDHSIQALNRLNTDLHRKDEASHAAIFSEITRSVYAKLCVSTQEQFKQYLLLALTDFVEPDFSFWDNILTYLNINTKDKILEQLKNTTTPKKNARDYSVFIRMLEQLGLKDELAAVFDFTPPTTSMQSTIAIKTAL